LRLSKDASNCRIYHDCADRNAPVLVQCPVGTQYDAKKELCESESKCIEIVCPETSKTSDFYVSYDNESPFSVLCSKEGYSLTIEKCSDDYVFYEPKWCVPRIATVDPTATTTATEESTTVGFTTNSIDCSSTGFFPGLYIETY
jgi:Chitin binding Peritrophin-A domain